MPFGLEFSYISGRLSNKNSFNRRQVSRLTTLARGKDLPASLWIDVGKTLDRGRKKLAHPQFFVLVGIQGGGIWIIRLGGCLSFHETPPHVP
jgi:hypothetical protein